MLRASVVIPTRNRPDLLARTVRSVVAQDFPPGDYEVLVVDDASTPPVEESFRGRRFPGQMKIIRLEENLGRARTRNVGIQAARGELLVLLDDDMEVVPCFLEAHLEAHRSNPRSATLGKIVAAPELGSDPLLRYLDSRGPEKVRRGQPIPSKYFVTGNCALPRTVLEEVGLFDESFSLYGGEDTELGIRLGRAGVPLRYVREALAYHLDVASLDRLCERLMAYGRESLPRMVAQHPELKSLLSLDILDPPRWGQEPLGSSLRRWLFRATMRPATYRLARAAAGFKILGKGLFPVYDYLRAYSYMTGYLEAGERKREE